MYIIFRIFLLNVCSSNDYTLTWTSDVSLDIISPDLWASKNDTSWRRMERNKSCLIFSATRSPMSKQKKFFLNLTSIKICVAHQRRRDCRCRRTSWHSVRRTAWPSGEQALWSERGNVPRPLFRQWLHRFWKPRSQCRREVVESANKLSCSIICKIPAMCPECYYLTLILSKATANAVATAANRWA